MFREFFLSLAAAHAEGDLRGHLAAWLWTVRHWRELDAPVRYTVCAAT